ncbi:hypothetical protein PV367_07440 [Streptomyces europaeiscabiei]|uniref:Uncharacterized protein n=1 Tax=Streptomyces europaeiscabiei TaxID=146819 RepID=A0AAJ2PLE9_9ACTN|nr:hypothetical protein [Streptomyces europaeiscabiei]MDX3129633.1 hypothetical protein [Streptomyces europaeiscabiei]
MAESLYDRYMKAGAANRAHGETCTRCSPDARCADGQRLYESFERLQDAYLAQQKETRG